MKKTYGWAVVSEKTGKILENTDNVLSIYPTRAQADYLLEDERIALVQIIEVKKKSK